jgi:hypothetical protein
MSCFESVTHRELVRRLQPCHSLDPRYVGHLQRVLVRTHDPIFAPRRRFRKGAHRLKRLSLLSSFPLLLRRLSVQPGDRWSSAVVFSLRAMCSRSHKVVSLSMQCDRRVRYAPPCSDRRDEPLSNRSPSCPSAGVCVPPGPPLLLRRRPASQVLL